jgi:transposase InsO family protein
MPCESIITSSFEEVLSDNGSEFGNRLLKQKDKHPFERLLIEMGVKHRYTKPYRPQTNGKIERFWRTIEEQFLEGTDFDSKEELKKELVQYLYYFNNLKPQKVLNGMKPMEMAAQSVTPAAGLEILNR